jgi:curved DNA-binding protein CbpA
VPPGSWGISAVYREDSELPHHKLVDTLLELHRTQCSCVLRLEHGAVKKQLFVSRGNIACAESNLPNEHLVQVLMELDLIARKDLQKISRLMKSGKTSEEAVALATGLDETSLAEAMREQAERILASFFAWSGYGMRLFDGNAGARRGCDLSLPMPNALVLAARRAVKDRTLPASCATLAGLIAADPAVGLRTSLPLSRAEAYAYSQVTSPTPVAQLLPLLPHGEAKPEESLQCLLLLGLLRMQTEAPDPTAAASLQEEILSAQVDDLLTHFEVANPYEILGVPPDARDEEIKAAYHEMARHYHPDRFEAKGTSPGFRARVERLFTYITGAYTTLGDPVVRANYDDTRLKQESQVEATLQSRAAAGADKDKMAEILFRSGRVSCKNKDFEKAVQQFRECVWLRSNTARYHHYLAVAQSEIPALRKEAEQHFLKAIELENMNPDTYLQLGKLYLKVNLPKRAEAQFCEALHWDSENAEARKLLDALAGKSPARL